MYDFGKELRTASNLPLDLPTLPSFLLSSVKCYLLRFPFLAAFLDDPDNADTRVEVGRIRYSPLGFILKSVRAGFTNPKYQASATNKIK